MLSSPPQGDTCNEASSSGHCAPKISSGWRSRTFCLGALTALSNQNLELNVITREWQGEKQDDWHIHICDPRKWGRISRERGFAHAARALWQQQQFDIVQSHERIPGCDIYRAGDGVHRRWLLQRTRILPHGVRSCLCTIVITAT